MVLARIMSDIRLHGAIGWRCGRESSGRSRAHSHCRGLHAQPTTCFDSAEACSAKICSDRYLQCTFLQSEPLQSQSMWSAGM